MKIAVFAAIALLLSGCMDAIHKPLAQLTLADLGLLVLQIGGSLFGFGLAWTIVDAWLSSRREERLSADEKARADRKRLGYD